MPENNERKLTCIQCPQGCQLIAELKNGYVIKITGNKCPRGEVYARQELENPQRTLTSTVKAVGLSVAMIPVKTDKPIPKNKLFEAMQKIKKITITKPINCTEIIIPNFLNLQVNLIATREVK